MDLSKYTKTLTSGQKAFFMAYIEAIYFTETGDNCQPSSHADLTDATIRQAVDDCRKFYNVYHEVIPDAVKAGHDFWFTRCGHGVGFWDRPEVYGYQMSQELTRASEIMGEAYVDFEE